MRNAGSRCQSAAKRPEMSRRAAGAGTLLLGILLVGLIANEVRSGRNEAFPRPMRASTVVDVAAQGHRARMVNPIVAAAAESAGGAGTILELPADHRSLLDIEQDDFGGIVQATLNADLISPFLGGRVRVAEYDAVLSARAVDALRESTDLRAYPRDVWAFPSEDGASTVRLHVDPSRTQIFVTEPAVAEELR